MGGNQKQTWSLPSETTDQQSPKRQMNENRQSWEMPKIRDTCIIPGYIEEFNQHREMRKAETGLVGNVWHS